MNEKEAIKIINSNVGGVSSNLALFHHAKGYLEGLAQGRSEGKAEAIDTAKGVEEALKKIDSQKMCELPDDMAERVATVTGLWISLKFIARESLAKYRKDR